MNGTAFQRALSLAVLAVLAASAWTAAGRYRGLLAAWDGRAFLSLPAPVAPPAPVLAAAPGVPQEPREESPRALRVRLPDASSVEVAGDFNGWTPAPLVRDASGDWTAPEPAPGTYRYVLRIDGRWSLDPGNPRAAAQGPGAVSLLEVR